MSYDLLYYLRYRSSLLLSIIILLISLISNTERIVLGNLDSSQERPSLSDIFRETENSVVQITNQPNATTYVTRQNALIAQATAFGSGFIYDNQGHIITNDHVIEGSKRVEVRFADGNIYIANVIGNDAFTDLAVLQIEHKNFSEKLIHVKLGNSSLLQVGQQVAAIGNPFGIQNLMTEGIIGGLNVLLPNNQTGFPIPDVIATDVPLNPGSSGGPLFDTKGEVIGINAAIAFAGQISELSYSISSNIIKKVIPELIAHGKYIHPWLGVNTATLSHNIQYGTTTTTASSMNYKGGGAVITSLQPGSPAAKANLQSTIRGKHIGDIIIAIDGHPINRSEDIINYIESTKSVDDTITLKLIRNGTTFQNVKIKLLARPNVISFNAAQNKKTITTIPTLSTSSIKNWRKIIGLSNSNISSQGPRIAVSGNNVYVVWEESIQSGNNKIMFAKSTDRGDTFSKPVNLTSGVMTDSETPSIAAFRNNVYIVWTDSSPGNFDIFFVKSTNGGTSFTKPMNLSNDPGISYQPRMATDGNNDGVYVLWTDNSPGNYNILFTKSIDGGNTFSTPLILTNDVKGVSNFPNIAISHNNNVYVVWSHKNNTDFDPSNTNNQTQTYDIFLTKSIDRGNTFSKPINLSNDPSNSQNPVVAISGNNNVYVVWTDNSIGTYETFLTKSIDRGNTFSKVTVVSSNVARSTSPSVSSYGSNLYIVWSDNAFGNSEIFFTESTDNGSTFNMPININNDTGISDLAQITTDPDDGGSSNNIYLVWQDNITGNIVIYFTKAVHSN
ncbi:MAG: trypsin-like peptidase domain-containing protein [Nitrososphaeraceae archaeon]|nr:trypsin-like peptidase domain-containing protein [Nitrososphaeraceae archaeon]